MGSSEHGHSRASTVGDINEVPVRCSSKAEDCSRKPSSEGVVTPSSTLESDPAASLGSWSPSFPPAPSTCQDIDSLEKSSKTAIDAARLGTQSDRSSGYSCVHQNAVVLPKTQSAYIPQPESAGAKIKQDAVDVDSSQHTVAQDYPDESAILATGNHAACDQQSRETERLQPMAKETSTSVNSDTAHAEDVVPTGVAPVNADLTTAGPDQGDESEVDAQMAEEQDLEVDEFESDSAFGNDSDIGSTTTSIAESIYNYRKEHGRTYHAYKDGQYIFPNDERECNRLDLQHQLFSITYGNRLHFAPLNDPRHCLDIGTGTGIWAMDFADKYPNCEVIGNDLSPDQPNLVPPNLTFVIEDAEDPWLFNHRFDYIHARLMAGTFRDWQNILQTAFRHLEPGGWLELQDYGLPVKSADGSADGTELKRWGELLCEAARKLGRPMGSDVSDMYEQWMRDVGFVDIEQKMFMWPSNSWPKDPFMKELGRWNQVNIMEGLEGFCLALLNRGLGWQKEEIDVLVAKVMRDLRDRSVHAYFPMPVTWGRKPYPGEH